MLKPLLILLFSLSSILSLAQTPLFVAAAKGLSIREKPSIKAKILGKIKYGEKITPIGYDNSLVTTEGFASNWIKVRAGKKTGYILGAYTFPFPPPLPGTASFEEYLKQLSSVSDFSKDYNRKTRGSYQSDLIKMLFANGAELWEEEGLKDMSTLVVIPQCSLQQAFQLVRLIGEFGGIVKADTPFPLKDEEFITQMGRSAVKIIHSEEAENGLIPVWKIRFERTQAAAETLEIFYNSDKTVICYEAGI